MDTRAKPARPSGSTDFADEVADLRAPPRPAVGGGHQPPVAPSPLGRSVSPRQVWHALDRGTGAKFLKELAWRDFARSAIERAARHRLGQRPARRWTPCPGAPAPAADADFTAWTKGRTGYPIVDAGMRQLWATGWMHNRVRMIAASFLTKHLLIDWRRGERWFWDTLVDADYGNNSLNWQWIAGTGTASQLFFRIMAPLVQSEKFDAGRLYPRMGARACQPVRRRDP